VEQATEDKTVAEGVETALDADCKWVADGTFDARRAQRKSEMDSISSAKDTLGDILSGKPVMALPQTVAKIE